MEPIHNVDKRVSRLQHRRAFVAVIDEFDQCASQSHQNHSDGPTRITVALRKRPMFPIEAKFGEFDVVSCSGNCVVIHDCRMRPDLHHMYIKQHKIPFDLVFSDKDTNETVAPTITDPLVEALITGGDATVMMFGQTGSGKTYTMDAVHERLASEIFSRLPDGASMTLIAFEMSGSHCIDLLNPGRVIQLLEHEDGDVVPHLAECVTISSATELLDALRRASSVRFTEATSTHDQSSRTHAVYRVSLTSGSLTMVDLAGSERNIDTMTHDPEKMRQTSQINMSLMNLKDCLRLRAEAFSTGTEMHVPYRRSRLTLFLRRALTSPQSIVTVVATVSPVCSNTEHSLNSAQHACLMGNVSTLTKDSVVEVDVPIHAGYAQTTLVHPKKWDHAAVQEWWHQVTDPSNFLPENIEGKDIVRWSAARFALAAKCSNDEGERLRSLLKECMSQANREADSRRDQIRSGTKKELNDVATILRSTRTGKGKQIKARHIGLDAAEAEEWLETVRRNEEMERQELEQTFLFPFDS